MRKLGTRSTQTLFLRSFFLIFFVTIFTFGSGCIKSFEEESYYNVRDMDISADRIGAAFIDLNVTTYVEKVQGDNAKNTSLLLKAYSRGSGLLETQKKIELGALKKGTTKSVSQVLTLPKAGGYDLQSVLFEDDVQKGNGKIKVYNLDALPADVQETGLGIPEMDFRVKKVEDGKVLVESDIYLTNEGRETSKDFRMLVKVREMDAGLLADKVWAHTGEIKPEATVIQTVNLTMPDKYNYVVEVLIWNNDTIVERGEDYIQLNPIVEVKDKSTTKAREIQTSEFENLVEAEEIPEEGYTSEKEAAPGFSLFLSAVLFCSAVILRRRFA
ncbi:DUF7490 domain-containing protein [Methanosarcina vacuolata]|uniref:DUF7490 domain-containing protein n=1 Tax=Methanosarcina vacuolata Z-761 TaxID=1434123 RepID=A0A0E3Q9Y6_9EURY|nr:hypothetical protein [Methanosarcina vacuolata]AKB45617.1 hypothetical protein MSVAZ_3348 [Methanosarcina vacuolata Z-761]